MRSPLVTFLIEALLHWLLSRLGGSIFEIFRKMAKKSNLLKFFGPQSSRVIYQAQIGVSKNARKSEVTKVKIFWKVMIFVKIFIFLVFFQKQLTFDPSISWNKLSDVEKYVYNSKSTKVQKWLKKELFQKNCLKQLNYCWFLIPFISSTNNDRHGL